MAKKIDFRLDDYGFDNGLDIPDFDFDIKPPKDDRNPVIKVAAGVARGFGSTIKDETFIREAVRNTLPRGYGSALDAAANARDSFKDLYNNSINDIKPVYNELKKTTQRLLPSAQRFLPNRFVKKLEAFAKSAEPEPHNRYYSDSDNNEMTSNLTEIFKIQEQATEQRFAEQDAKDRIKEGIDFSKHKESFNQLNAIRLNTQQLVSYQNTVGNSYQRKSLELKYRTFFANRDLLLETKKSNAETKSLLESITKNTGLPEFAKLKQSERLSEALRNKFIGQFADGLFGYRQDFIKKVGTNFSKTVRGRIGEAVSGLRSGLSGANSIIDGAEMADSAGVDLYGTGGEVAGTGAAYLAASDLGRRFRDRLGKNEKLAKVSNTLQYQVNNLPQRGEEFARSSTGSAGLMGGLVDMFKDAILAGRPGRHVEMDNIKNLQEPGVFSRQTNKSIIEVIPGLLSRIHQELRIIRTGDPKLDMISYDFTTNRFSEQATVSGNIVKSIMLPHQQTSVKANLDALINEIDPDKSLSEEARKALGAQLLVDNMNNRMASPERLSNRGIYRDDASKHSDKYAQLFKDYFDKDPLNKRKLDFSEKFNDLGRFIDVDKEQIQNIVNAGQAQSLSDAGILSTGGPDQRTPTGFIDFNKYFSYYHGNKFNPEPNLASGGINPTAFTGGSLPPGSLVQDPTNINKTYNRTSNTTRNITLSADTDKIIESIHEINPNQALAIISQTLDRLDSRFAAGIPTFAVGTEAAQVVESLNQQAASAAPGKEGFFKLLMKTSRLGANILGKNTMRLRDISGSIVQAGITSARELARNAGQLAGIGIDTAASRSKQLYDVYVEGKASPALIGWKLQAGHYRDSITREVIKSYKDITSDVRDEDGNIVLTVDQLKNSFVKTPSGRKAIMSLGALSKGVNKVKQSLFSKITSLDLTKVGLFAKQSIARGREKLEDGYDVFVNADLRTPLLESWKLKAGKYFDKDGKVINSYRDIKDAIYDETGKIVASAKELENSFIKTYSGVKPFSILNKALSQASRFGNEAVSQAIKAGSSLFKMGKGGLQSGLDYLESGTDIFVKGMPGKAALRSHVMRAGGYFSAKTGKVIKKFSDIDGEVVDASGTPVLTDDQIKQGLVDEKNNPIRTGLGIVGAKAFSASKLLGKVAGKGLDFLVSGVNQGLGRAANLLTNIFGEGFNLISNKPVVNKLQEIYDLLDSRLGETRKKILGDIDGDGVRDGSFEDQKAKKAESEKESKAEKLANAATGGGWNNSIYGMGAGALKKLFGKKDKDEKDSDDGDTYVMGGSLGGDGEGKGKGGKGGKAGKTGRFGKIGRGLGKLGGLAGGLGKAVGLGAAGMAGLNMLNGDMSLSNIGIGVAGLATTEIGRKGMMGAARLGVGAVAQAGRLAMAGATGLVTLIGLPATLAIGATALAGYGAYKLYGYLTEKKLQDLSKIRFAQYGFLPSDESNFPTILELEEKLKPAIIYKDGIADIDEGQVDVKGLVSGFNVDLENEQQTQSWFNWFVRRFKPIYLTHLTALKLTSASTPLSGVDDKLSPPEKKKYLDIIKFPEGPYNIRSNPFPQGVPLRAGPDEIARLIQIAEDAIKNTDSAKKPGTDTTDKALAAGTVAAAGTQLKADGTLDKDKPPPGLFTRIANYLRGTDSGQQGTKTGRTISPGITGAGGAAFGTFNQAGSPAAGTHRPITGDAAKNRALLIQEAKSAGITDPSELAMFLAQIDHESGGFKALEENLNYSPARLLQIFPKYFRSTAEAEAAAAAGPAGIANRVYGGRMGNTLPGDGYKYRGRGLIQLTGKDNYTAAGKALGIDLVNNPDLAADAVTAAKIAVWFWKSRNGLGAAGRSGDVLTATRLINGGTNGLSDRGSLYTKYLAMARDGKLDGVPASTDDTALAKTAPAPAVAPVAAGPTAPAGTDTPVASAPEAAPAAAPQASNGTQGTGFGSSFAAPVVPVSSPSDIAQQQRTNSGVMSDAMGSMKDSMSASLATQIDSLAELRKIVAILAQANNVTPEEVKPDGGNAKPATQPVRPAGNAPIDVSRRRAA